LFVEVVKHLSSLLNKKHLLIIYAIEDCASKILDSSIIGRSVTAIDEAGIEDVVID
jgi:hypothetical protein